MITIEAIQITVADHFAIERSDITGPSRQRVFAWPRQVAMHLARAKTHQSLPGIARAFRRDHTSVLHGNRAVDQRMSDAMHKADYQAIEQRIDALMAGPVFRSCRAGATQ